jgi:cell division transport system permease protein
MSIHPASADSAIILAPMRGGPTIWVLAIMTCLAMLGLAAALTLAPAASALSGQLAGRATVQIVAADPIVRRESVAAVRAALADAPFVSAVRAVPEAELADMAAQWLGDGVQGTGLPLPALIDVDLVGDRAASMQRLAREVARAAPSARVIAHADWLEPVVRLMASVAFIAAAIACALILAAAAVAVLAARGALAAQRSTIDILHLVGATDTQIVRMFQRNTARESLVGTVAGGAVSVLLLGLVAWQLSGIASGLFTETGSGLRYLLLLLVPLAVLAIVVFSARIALIRALRAMP